MSKLFKLTGAVVKKLTIAFFIMLCSAQAALAWKISPVVDINNPSFAGIVENGSTYGSVYKKLQEVTGLKMPNTADQKVIKNAPIWIGDIRFNSKDIPTDIKKYIKIDKMTVIFNYGG